ncbi:MAG: PIN domain-containing protein [Gemmatimonadaceae bacterium]
MLIDTNIVLDLVLARAQWANDAALLFDAIARERFRGFLAGHAVTTVHYIVERATNSRTAATAIADLLQILTIVPLDAADFQRALAMNLNDYEDAVQVAACLKVGADFLVTRNQKDFKGGGVATRAPAEVLALLAAL